MALLGPMVVVAEKPAAELLDVLGTAGAFPIVETNWARAPAAVGEILPAALLLADPAPAADPHLAEALIKKLEARGGPFMPVLACVSDDDAIEFPSALPIALDEPPRRLLARLTSALRVRALHVTV